MVTLLIALQIWCLSKLRTRFWDFFPSFSLKAYNYLLWVPEVFLACGGNFCCWPKADKSSAVGWKTWPCWQKPESALEKSLAPRVIIITLNITYDQIFITEKSQHYGNIFMKTFYNVVEAIICCAKEARALIVLDIEWVQFVLQNCEKL